MDESEVKAEMRLWALTAGVHPFKLDKNQQQQSNLDKPNPLKCRHRQASLSVDALLVRYIARSLLPCVKLSLSRVAYPNVYEGGASAQAAA